MTEPRQLSADDILGADDLEIKAVDVPEWKGTVHLRVLPADEGLALNDKMQALPKERQHEAIFLLLGACLVGSDGRRMFTTEDQLARIRTRSQKVLIRLQKMALQLQGWTEDPNTGKGA
jgi:hypothetical protein